jgi:molybdopterin-binding protein
MNQLIAVVEAVESSAHLSHLRVVCHGSTLHLLLAEVCSIEEYRGHKVTLAFKESEVILLTETIPSTANILSGTIESIDKGAVLTQVSIASLDHSIVALVPTATFDAMMLNIGNGVSWMVSPSEISLLRGNHGN